MNKQKHTASRNVCMADTHQRLISKHYRNTYIIGCGLLAIGVMATVISSTPYLDTTCTQKHMVADKPSTAMSIGLCKTSVINAKPLALSSTRLDGGLSVAHVMLHMQLPATDREAVWHHWAAHMYPAGFCWAAHSL